MSSNTNADVEVSNGSSQPEPPADPTAPRRLSLVCKFWREIVTSFPLLWTSMVIGNFSADPNGFVEMYLYLVSTPTSWNMFCPSNLIKHYIYDLTPRSRPNATELRQSLELSQDTLQVLAPSAMISHDYELADPLAMSHRSSVASSLHFSFRRLDHSK
ncbi:hypothetical protein DFS33DRAFT_1278584 [Desarmillaria ectypa]|nr:hypothetical protein DFS33DRAFT_1278584 [Desarmillaria ectypa]